MYKLLIFTFSFLSVTTINQVKADDVNKELTYSHKSNLKKFKETVSSILPHDYMREDNYLIRWLQAKDFNVAQAEKFLKEDLRWRKARQLDKLHFSDFSDLVSDYPVYVDTYDKNGAPVVTAANGRWDLREAHVSGRGKRLLHFLDKVLEEAATQVRAAHNEGKNVTKFQLLMNLDGFNLVTHGCPTCILGFVKFMQSIENHFPGLLDRLVIINAPPTIQTVAQLVRPRISSLTQRHIKVFASNRAEWQKYLLGFISKDQLTEDLGGTRIRTSKC